MQQLTSLNIVNQKKKIQYIDQRLQNVQQVKQTNKTSPSVLSTNDDIDTEAINGGNQKISFSPYDNKILFTNLQYQTQYYLNTKTGENNFALPNPINDLTINKLTLTQSLRVFPETQLLIGPSNLQATYTISGLVDQINTNKITNEIQAQQIQTINVKNQEQDDQIRVIKQKNVEQDNRLNQIDNQLNEMQEEIEEIEEKDVEQDNLIAYMQEEIDENGDDIEQLYNQLLQINEEIDEVEEEMHEADTILHGQIHLLQSAVDQDRLTNNLAHQNLQNQINQINNAGFESRISALESAVQTIQGQISSMNQTINGMADDISDLNENLNQEIQDRQDADAELDDKIDEATNWEKFEDVIEFMEETEEILAEIIEIIEDLKIKISMSQNDSNSINAKITLATQYLQTLAQKRQSLMSHSPLQQQQQEDLTEDGLVEEVEEQNEP